MCGITGFIKTPEATEVKGEKKYSLFSKPITNADDVLITLGEFCNRRGKDNHGVMVLGQQPWSTITRDKPGMNLRHCTVDGMFETLTKTQGFFLNRSVEKSNAAFIHTRKASSGGATVKNAHPVVHEDIVLMHNGTLESGWRVHASTGCPSDTTGIAEVISKKGAKWAYENLEGPMTMVWYDGNTNLIRHSKRPLYSLEAQGYIFFASESWMIQAALDINGIEFSGVPELLPVNTHLVYDNDGNLLSSEVYKPKKTVTTGYYDSYWNQLERGRSGSRGNLAPKVVNLPVERKQGEILPLSSVKFGDPIIGSVLSFVPYSNNPGRGILRLCYDCTSSIAPSSDNSCYDITIHAVSTKLGSFLVRYATAVLTKATGIDRNVKSVDPRYRQGFMGNHICCIPVFDYTADSKEITHELGTAMLDLVKAEFDTTHTDVSDKVTLQFPDWDRPRTVGDIFKATQSYFDSYHHNADDLTNFPFDWDHGCQKFIPEGFYDEIVPPTYERHILSKVVH